MCLRDWDKEIKKKFFKWRERDQGERERDKERLFEIEKGLLIEDLIVMIPRSQDVQSHTKTKK